MSPCPACGSADAIEFYAVDRVATRETGSFRAPEAARAGPYGRLRMRACRACGFAWNDAFDPALVRFDETTEIAQTASPAYNRFVQDLARELDRRCGGLAGRHLVELGCAQGDFLRAVCPALGARGTGFDPVLRRPGPAGPGIELRKALYGPDTAPDDIDLLVHLNTLEHEPAPLAHLRMLRATLAVRPGARLFVMLPDFASILREHAFWTVHYEHCAYWTPGALARALRRAGFAVTDLWRAFSDQLVCALATVGPAPVTPLALEEPAATTAAAIDGFAAAAGRARDTWRRAFAGWRRSGRSVTLWGAAPRTIAFLQAVAEPEAVDRIVDVNPAKRGLFLPGTGYPIVHPDDLREAPPAVVVVMNPVYTEEIRAMLAERGLRPELLRVDRPPGLSPA